MNDTTTQYHRKSAIIVCHDAMFGPPHELRDYLLSHGIQRLLFIGHQNRTMVDNDITSSYFERYVNGVRVEKHISPVMKLPEFVGYIHDSILTLIWSMTKAAHSDYFIGLGNLNAFGGLILKILGVSKRVYYYAIDYIPNRFHYKIVSQFYLWIDKVAAQYSDTTWNYAKRMVVEREVHWKATYGKQIIVPNGIHIRKNILQPFSRVIKSSIVYLGTLTESQGIHMVIRALPLVQKEISDIQLTIIGKGAYQNTLAGLVKDLHLTKQVIFAGYIEDPVKTDMRIASNALGVATYNPKTSFIIYAEPGKVKRYLSCGVPVLMTDVTPLGKEIKKNMCGLLCSYDTNDIAKKVIAFMKDTKQQKEYRTNAVKYAGHYEWDRVFTDAFLQSS